MEDRLDQPMPPDTSGPDTGGKDGPGRRRFLLGVGVTAVAAVAAVLLVVVVRPGRHLPFRVTAGNRTHATTPEEGPGPTLPGAPGYVRNARWVRPVGLDGGRFTIDRPLAASASSCSKAEALADLRSTNLRHTPTITLLGEGWGRVTVRSPEGAVVAGFDHRPAWALVFRSGPGISNCPSQTVPDRPAGSGSARTTPPPPPGDLRSVQVFVIADDGTAVQYSQPGSWFCGYPAAADVDTPHQLFAATWSTIPNDPSQVVKAAVPDCVDQPRPPLMIPVAGARPGTVAVSAVRPFPPVRCPGTTTVLVRRDPPTPTAIVSTPTPIECLNISTKPTTMAELTCKLGA